MAKRGRPFNIGSILNRGRTLLNDVRGRFPGFQTRTPKNTPKRTSKGASNNRGNRSSGNSKS